MTVLQSPDVGAITVESLGQLQLRQSATTTKALEKGAEVGPTEGVGLGVEFDA